MLKGEFLQHFNCSEDLGESVMMWKTHASCSVGKTSCISSTEFSLKGCKLIDGGDWLLYVLAVFVISWVVFHAYRYYPGGDRQLVPGLVWLLNVLNLPLPEDGLSFTE